MKILVRILFLVALVIGAGSVLAQPAKQKHFATAEEAATALTEAIRKDDDKAVQAILGTGWRDIIPGTTGHEDDLRERYLEAWDKNHKIIPDGGERAYVEAGTTGWRSPLPLIKDAAGWYFDVEAGRKEIIAREIGRNEYTVIQTLLAIVDAQREYVSLNPMKDRAPTYARRLLSSPGKMDGLYWEAKPGEPESPIGELVAKAQPGDAEGQGYWGYRFRMLYAQGPSAPGGAYSYLVNNRMIAGFAVIAWPVTYGETGVMTFMVSQSGDVYERDFGPDTATAVANVNAFNPDDDWDKADMTPPPDEPK
ncbi:DUF2950 domain-containing protein [Reyranella soli]|uniref:DUF2950 domain-containing protein n=1 Tax=Reyranella soli TaxID=1230389 RepID=A0A512N2Z2_9HYPH|nr:DUF2950 domain-containing protein [Reyranella soli]GEP53357.1 hypothetical protein RSO01_05230 [Reyranella soli]